MPETKHSPGPWELQAHKSYLFVIAEVATGMHIASVGDSIIKTDLPLHGSIEIKANAVLIAAAPELLAFVKNLTEALEMAGEKNRFPKLYRDATALIRKAEGPDTQQQTPYNGFL